MKKRHTELKAVRKITVDLKDQLITSTTWMKRNLILFSINRLQNNISAETSQRHQNKLDTLIVNKHIIDGIKPNPNTLVTNLTDFELTVEELEVLNLGLKHGILLRPQEAEMFSVVEDIYDQISRHNAFNDHHFAKARVPGTT
ncbi:MAG: hypothetical protein AAFY76_01795 [Cyanobacteria bacterium J06649_11]